MREHGLLATIKTKLDGFSLSNQSWCRQASTIHFMLKEAEKMNDESAHSHLTGGIMKRIDHDDLDATLYIQVSCPDGLLRCLFFEDAMFSGLSVDDAGLPFSRLEEVSMKTLTSADYISAALRYATDDNDPYYERLKEMLGREFPYKLFVIHVGEKKHLVVGRSACAIG